MREGDAPARLRRTDVGADDFCVGVLVADINSPNAGPGTDVENATRVISDGGKEELAVHGQTNHPVGEIEAVKLALVTRSVCAFCIQSTPQTSSLGIM